MTKQTKLGGTFTLPGTSLSLYIFMRILMLQR